MADHPGTGDNGENPVKNDTPKPLTGIRDAYTLAATPGQNGDEVNDLIIKQFLTALAEIAHSVASRAVRKCEGESQ
jgi:hypothetical protein